jgi:hypothetical protein
MADSARVAAWVAVTPMLGTLSATAAESEAVTLTAETIAESVRLAESDGLGLEPVLTVAEASPRVPVSVVARATTTLALSVRLPASVVTPVAVRLARSVRLPASTVVSV